jgi:hypothetical protein
MPPRFSVDVSAMTSGSSHDLPITQTQAPHHTLTGRVDDPPGDSARSAATRPPVPPRAIKSMVSLTQSRGGRFVLYPALRVGSRSPPYLPPKGPALGSGFLGDNASPGGDRQHEIRSSAVSHLYAPMTSKRYSVSSSRSTHRGRSGWNSLRCGNPLLSLR